MFSLNDDALARARYNELLKEAEDYRRFAHLAAGPNVFERAFAALKSVFVSKRSQPAREAQTQTMRKGLATE
jgi:hypothetical protein